MELHCFSIVRCSERANDGVVACSAIVSRFLDTSIVTSPQLSDATASSIGISSEHSTVSGGHEGTPVPCVLTVMVCGRNAVSASSVAVNVRTIV